MFSASEVVRSAVWRRLARVTQLLLVGVLPAYLLAAGVARFMLNHFFAQAPYLVDSGLLSALTYRAGALLQVPPFVDNFDSFYQVYVSPFMSLFSGLSYLVPVERMEWFAFVEAMVYFPIGLAVYAVASRLDPAGALRRLPITILAALAFSFHGLVVWTVGYPHFEVAIAGFSCLLLAAVVTGRTRLAWVCLVLAASVRQDGGFHAAVALAPLLYLRWRGVDMAPSRRGLAVAIAVSIAASFAAIFLQKLFLVPLDRLTAVYLGDPAFGHLSAAVLVERTRHFFATCQVIYYPFAATLLIALLRRDPRYLLGWAASGPWFLVNFLAFDSQKSAFVAYTVTPFIVSVFWVYLYGALLAPPARRLRPGLLEGAFALVCLASTLGFHRGAPVALEVTMREMTVTHPRNRPAIHRFVDALTAHHAGFGRLYADTAVTAIAVELLRYPEIWRPGVTDADTIAFHHQAVGSDAIPADLVANRLDRCTRIVRTGIFVCTRERLPRETFAGIKTQVFPAFFAFTNLKLAGVEVNDRGVALTDGGMLGDQLGYLPRGAYEVTMELETEIPLACQSVDMARLEVFSGESMLGAVTVTNGARELRLRFAIGGDRQHVGYRLASLWPFPMTVTAARVRQVAP